MKWTPDTRTLELTERNVAALTAKLDDPLSARTLITPCQGLMVTAVEDDAANPAALAENVLHLTRSQLLTLAEAGATVTVADVRVVAVPDAAHYANRLAGEVYMPSSGERW
ncbi:MAG: hypothetical protein KDB70_19720 [Mycobacterium sp.]|mgnify:CR=1 FL=1|jgi:hypothetical protein|nr:hypothetical protein [Mycobacterium sp.]